MTSYSGRECCSLQSWNNTVTTHGAGKDEVENKKVFFFLFKRVVEPSEEKRPAANGCDRPILLLTRRQVRDGGRLLFLIPPKFLNEMQLN